jgi:hypothetical protein
VAASHFLGRGKLPFLGKSASSRLAFEGREDPHLTERLFRGEEKLRKLWVSFSSEYFRNFISKKMENRMAFLERRLSNCLESLSTVSLQLTATQGFLQKQFGWVFPFVCCLLVV